VGKHICHPSLLYVPSLSASVRELVIAAMFFSVIITSGYWYQNAFACQYTRFAPERYYEMSDVISIRRVSNTDRNPPLDEATPVSFNVPKSWKGVDTKIITIRTGDGTSCGYYRFEQGQESLVYGAKNLSAIDITLCGGTATTDSSPFVNLDFQFLENSYVPIELRAGYTMRINLFPIITIVGSLVAISIAAFVVFIKRA